MEVAAMAPSDGFEQLMDLVREDPLVLGVVLTGSHAHGLATEDSDYDVGVILRDDVSDQHRSIYGELAFPNVDLGVSTLREFAEWAAWDTEFSWARYSFAHAVVLVDRTGEIAPLVAEKGSIADEHRQPFVRGALDAFINSVYRSLKCVRRGNVVCARLEAADAVGHALAVIYALEGRLRPYAGSLAYEIREHPLRAFPLAGDELLTMISAIVEDGDYAALQRLFASVLQRAREEGFGAVIDDWGDNIDWMLTYHPN
jgi:hypothetical protein